MRTVKNGPGNFAGGVRATPAPDFRFHAFRASAYGLGMKKREPVSRCSISLPKKLLSELDQMTEKKGYDNRSLAMADMIRDHLAEHHGQSGAGEMAGTISIVYDHHKRRLQEDLTEIQHDHGRLIIASMHVHLDHDHCLEVLVTRGKARELQSLADALIAAKGVKHGRLTMVSTGKDLPA